MRVYTSFARGRCLDRECIRQVAIIMDALRPYMRLLCGRGTGFGLIAHPLCVGEENGWEVAYVA